MGKIHRPRDEEESKRHSEEVLTLEVQKRYQEILLSGTWEQLRIAIVEVRPDFATLPDTTFQIMFHQGRAARPGIPDKLKDESTKWLLDRKIPVTQNLEGGKK